MKKSIVWLASYPKSGNTWFRSFVTALQKNGRFSINELETDGIFSGKNIIENTLDLSSDFLSDEQVFNFQPLAWNFFAQSAKKDLLVKIHDAIFQQNGKWNIPLASSSKAIYFVRHPFDVVPSLANHQGSTIDETVGFLCDQQAFFVKKNQSSNLQFRQNLFTWQMHVQSWQTINDFPVLFIRYEDMLNKSFETFKKTVNFLGWNHTDSAIQEAIEACSFDKLQSQENTGGFKEKSNKSDRFFNKGTAGYGKELLSSCQKERILAVNGEVMQQFNYK